MKSIARILMAVLCVAPSAVLCAPVASTRGNNLTAYSGASGATNNNNWNTLMNSRSGVDAADMPVADFGNCNAVVLRCAQPKCANGGCTDMNVTYAIVAGCVQSNDACKKYGDDLVQYISAQLVAQSTAKSNAAQTAAANAAAQQSAQQLQQMQMQMQQMQSQMAAQNAETVAQLQSALEEQKQLTAQAIADATAAREPVTTGNVYAADTADAGLTAEQAAASNALTVAQQIAAQNGVSADVLAREQITGQIMSSIENAETQLKALKTTMTDAFDYAGCDSKGNNCTGPKRVKVFKQKAMDFFEPYENVLDEIYDALITAQAVGVDITDIYMMLNDSCNVWGKYMCEDDQVLRYTKNTCVGGKSVRGFDDFIIGGANCTIGKIIPVSDGGCQPLGLIPNDEEVRYNWLNPDTGEGTNIKVGCMSDMLETSALFRNRKKGASIDIATLERIIEQDAPSVYGSRFGGRGGTTAPYPDGVKFCAVNEESFADLEKIVSLKTLPNNVCVNDTFLTNELSKTPKSKGDDKDLYAYARLFMADDQKNCKGTWDYERNVCNCTSGWWSIAEGECVDRYEVTEEMTKCADTGGYWGYGECVCQGDYKQSADKKTCIMPEEEW